MSRVHEVKPGLWLVLDATPRFIAETELAAAIADLETKLAAEDVLAMPPGQIVQWVRDNFALLPHG